MAKKVIWLVLSCLMVLSLVMVSCGGDEDTGGTVTTTDKGQTVTVGGDDDKTPIDDDKPTIVPSGEPQYGGTLTLIQGADPSFDLISFGATWPQEHAHQRMYDGDWTKGPAGGYGEDLTDWGESTRIPELNIGTLATDYGFEVSADGTEVTSWFTIRDGVHYAMPDTEAGRMVGGREITIDDVVDSWNRIIKDENAQNWQLYPHVRYPTAVKTGPNSFEVTHKLEDHIDAMMRENLCARVMPSEVWDTYGYESATDWRHSVGTGQFMFTDYVVGNLVRMDRNPSYWKTDPIGPGQGNQLPYVDTLKYIIMPDASTQQAGLRTGKLDQLGGLYLEDKDLMVRTAPDLQWAARGQWGVTPIFMKTTDPPFNDVKVRRALLMATDFNEINEGLYSGLGDIISWPYFRVKGYEPLFVSLDDPDCTDTIKELFTYNPDKAKQLLAEAGYPNGLKTSLVLTSTAVDYYSIIQEMWAKAGIEMELDIAADFGALIGRAFSITYDLISIFTSPNSSYPEQSLYAVRNWVNASLINEAYVDETAKAVKELAITDFYASMELCRPLVIYLIEQAYCIPTPRVPTYAMWWPWLKNYSGENSLGYWGTNQWSQYVWIDQTLKESMGY
ncbi:MAG: ABC transporter substrate-binding protein [Dehalococcoidales bacterium]|nr:MAG: ABC transporter substrate-binding protein [Dehalococcoidales bacterium]